jgi:hypothetical protein
LASCWFFRLWNVICEIKSNIQQGSLEKYASKRFLDYQGKSNNLGWADFAAVFLKIVYKVQLYVDLKFPAKTTQLRTFKACKSFNFGSFFVPLAKLRSLKAPLKKEKILLSKNFSKFTESNFDFARLKRSKFFAWNRYIYIRVLDCTKKCLRYKIRVQKIQNCYYI